jgi:ABC-type sugar transport system permease subunit
LDGADEWQQFWLVKLPLLWDVVQILVVLWVINAVQSFALIFVITRGYPNVAEVLGTYIYWAGFQGQSIGYASAMGVIMFVLVLAFSLLVNRLMRRETIEY